ncbi:MAG: hypothetical protein LUI12_01650 [Clostridiales bacterium]|nr:hypothetical protein [Clostridiales bacterium]
MANKYSPGDTAFLVGSNRFIQEVKILKFGGGLYTVRFADSGGGIKVRENRLFATKEDAEASLKKENKPRLY